MIKRLIMYFMEQKCDHKNKKMLTYTIGGIPKKAKCLDCGKYLKSELKWNVSEYNSY